jgi:hypothetical protein
MGLQPVRDRRDGLIDPPVACLTREAEEIRTPDFFSWDCIFRCLSTTSFSWKIRGIQAFSLQREVADMSTFFIVFVG